MKEGEFYTSVGESWTLSILLSLKDAGRPLILKDFASVSKNVQSLRLRLDLMEKDGLIDMTVMLTGHKTVSIRLTDIGKDVALLLSVADGLISPEKKTCEKSIDMRYADPILRMLRGKEFMVQKDILDEIKSYATVTRVLWMMEDDGLIVHSVYMDWPREHRYSLTVLGRQIAEIYQAIWEKIDSVRIKG